jgi:formylmethanofuran dehydrogenase subunit C
MSLILRLKQPHTIPLEVDSVRLEVVREQSLDDVLRTPIQYGNAQVSLGEFFDASGSAADNELVWEGDCSRVKLIGAQLTEGTMRVEGDAGMHLGAQMRGGEIIVTGNTADWAGAEMHAGGIHIRGNAGDFVGAVYRGGRRGMTGGEILIDGDAGNEVGRAMRRGLIAVGGRAGDAIGFDLIAGSILASGAIGNRPGGGMKRGTIAFLGTDLGERPGPPPQLLPTFKFAGVFRPVFLRFYLKHLREMGFFVPDECFPAAYRRYCGDFLELGKGEILIRATS